MALIAPAKPLYWAGLLLIAAFVSGCATDLADRPTTAITNVTVIDVRNGKALPRQTVLIANGKIQSVTPSPAASGTALTIDGSGKYLIPGLWDAHVHLSYAGSCALPVLVANGVTGVRDLGGPLEELQKWRSAVRSGRLVGPLIRLAGPNVESGAWMRAARQYVDKDPALARFRFWEISPRITVDTPDEARDAVPMLLEMGAEIIKFRNLGGEPLIALAQESNARGVPLAGHAPREISLATAAKAGQDSIEHAESLVARFAGIPDAERTSQLRRMAAAGMMLTPTLVTDLAGAQPEQEHKRALEDPSAYPFVSSSLRNVWQFGYETRGAGGDRDWTALLEQEAEVLMLAKAAGVQFMVGSDLGAPLISPGTSVHDEMEALVQRVHLPAQEVLRAATITPAMWLGLDEERGEIRPRYSADLVLLTANPLADIANVRKIEGVFLEGRWFAREQLDEILATARARIAAGAECVGAIE